jgi:hypothetical protein
MTSLCIVRVTRGVVTSTTWAALVLLYRVGTGGRGGQGHGRKVIPHVINNVSGALSFVPIFLFFSLYPLDLSSNWNAILLTLGTVLSSMRRSRQSSGKANCHPAQTCHPTTTLMQIPRQSPPSGGGMKVLGTLEQHRLHGEHLKGHSAIVPERTRRRGQ